MSIWIRSSARLSDASASASATSQPATRNAMPHRVPLPGLPIGRPGPRLTEDRARPRRLRVISGAVHSRPALLALALVACLACRGDEPVPGLDRGAAAAGRSRATRGPTPRTRRAAPWPAARTRTPGKRILFGDLHVHTTYSIDAFVYALPIFAGEGAHPPADACDFARYCSQLDFFSLNDHAEALTPAMWASTKQSLRECNERAGDPADPDLVAFVGWEWTQVGAHARDPLRTQERDLPGPRRGRAAAAADHRARARRDGPRQGALVPAGAPGAALRRARAYADFLWRVQQLADLPSCEAGVDTRELPDDCRENAATPAELFEKLAQWGFDTIVIPHGLAWGVHAPPGANPRTPSSRARSTIPSASACSRSSRATATARSSATSPSSSWTRTASASAPRRPPTTCPAAGAPASSCASAAAIFRRTSASAASRRPSASCWRPAPSRTGSCPTPAGGLARLRPVPRLLQARAHAPRPAMSAQYGAALSNFDEPDARRHGRSASAGASSRRATTTAAAPAPATRSSRGSR